MRPLRTLCLTSLATAVLFLGNFATAQCTLSTVSPSVTICTPANNANVTSPVHVVAGTTSSTTVKYVQIYVDGVKKFQVSASKLDTFVSMPSGTRRLTVQAANSSTTFKSTIFVNVGSGTSTGSFTVRPRNVALTFTQKQQFTTGTSVTWAVDGIAGGNATVGTISSTGLYTPPHVQGRHTVTARSTSDSTRTGSANAYVTNYPGVFTSHNDKMRTGQNLGEIALSPSNVKTSTFGKLGSYAVDGFVYAQPLYVANVAIPNRGFRNIVYVATLHDSVYAFDADRRSTTPLWKRSFINPGAGITTIPFRDFDTSCCGILETGIVGTPVIDRASSTLYVVVATKENGTYHQRLHALSLTTGAEKLGGPVEIRATVPGRGVGSSGGNLTFSPLRHLNRPGLLLHNGNVYIAFGSHGDKQPYHGWIMAYSASTLLQIGVICITPNGEGGAIWQSGGGLSADAAGFVYTASGDGTFTANASGRDYGDSILKLNPNALSVADFFTPDNQSTLNVNDQDLGSTGVLVLPNQSGAHTHLALAGSKRGGAYLVDRDNMGRFNSSTNDVVQFFTAAGKLFSTPAYWFGTLYFVGISKPLQAHRISNGLINTTAASKSSKTFEYPGATPSISSKGSTNGIVWLYERNTTLNRAVLHAYSASNVSQLLYNSRQNSTRDLAASAPVRFAVPTIANGKVFIGTQSQLVIYGLLP
ncbi:MAG TPA: Ig-like domain-containing protein [Clostridia bacterium]|nr:Ig-like domain-containing protein [Clostridia bacterium]